MDTVKTIFGVQTKKEKAAIRAAQDAQIRSARTAEEEARLQAASRTTSGVRLRLNGKRSLAFGGNEAGLSASLGG